MKVRKRNGNLVDFESEKIVIAIKKAMAETDAGVDSEIARAIAQTIEDKFKDVDDLTIEKIQEMVSDFYKIKLEDFMAKKRTRQIAYPRQIAMYLCRELTNASLPRIGEMFGGRDHTTVIHAHDKIAQERLQDLKLDSTLKDLVTRIQS